MNILIRDERVPCSSEVLEYLWMPTSSSPAFDGSNSIVNFERVHGHPTERPFFHSLEKEENYDEDYDGCFHPPGKKRRLTVNQVQFLETNFEVENKLEPERKVQLAKELGLQPRQVAIWFQNRRARFKTKQLEKDYDSLKASYDSLKSDYEDLVNETEKLKNEVLLLKNKLGIGEKDEDQSEPRNSMNSPRPEPQKQILNTDHENASNVPMFVCKQEDASSAKSDVFDSESSHYGDGNYSSLLEPADSSHFFGHEQSDFSQDEEENFSRSLLHPPCFPKLKDGCYHDLPENARNFGFPDEDQPFYAWQY